MQNKPTSTLLFRLSNELNDSVAPTSEKKPAFYWFNNRYHDHIPGDTPPYKFINFFIVKPDGKIKLFTRHGKGDFRSMWLDYEAYLAAQKSNPEKYNEPGIVLSFNTITPLVIGRFEDGFNLIAQRTDTGREANFSLGKLGSFTQFDKIPELVDLMPEVLSAVPVATLSQSVSDFWSQDSENAGRMWL